MRIRKNLKSDDKLSGDSSENAPLQPHHCKFNQNPWDVEPLSSLPLSSNQLERDALFENGGLGDFNEALQSVASLKIYSTEEEGQQEEEEIEVIYCSKTDDNGNFICGLEAMEGETLCKFHLKGHIAAVPKKSNKSGKNNGGKKSKFESESNPYEALYYYTGFGPSWRKRRGAQESSKNDEVVTMTTLSSSTQLENNEDNAKGSSEDEVVEDEEEDVEVENYKENGKKRGRKRIKARSLKSLM